MSIASVPTPSEPHASNEDVVLVAPIEQRHIPGPLRLVRRAGLVLVVQVTGAGLAFGLQILLARLLGVSNYGVYAYVLVWATFASLIAGLGFPAASIRFLPVYRVRQDWARLHGFLRATSRLTFTTGFVMALCGIGVALALYSAGELKSPAVVVLGALIIPALAGSMLYAEFSRASEQVKAAYIPPLLIRPSLIGIGAAGLFVVRGSLSESGALGATVVAGYTILVVQYVLTRHLFAGPKTEHKPVMERREWFAVGMPLLAAGAFTTTLMQVDIVVVGAFRGPRDAGIYAAASKTAALVAFILLAVNAAAAPQFASLWALGRIDDLQRLLTRLASVIFWPSLAISVGIAALSGPLLSLFGPEFINARSALFVLLIGQLINATAGSVGYLLNVTGHHRDAARALGWSALACIPLTVAGVWAFGVIGAALASMLGFTLWNGWLYWLVVRKLGVHASIFATLLPLHRRTSQLSGNPK